MYKAFNIVLSVFMLVFFLMPEETAACAAHTKEVVKEQKSCCTDSQHEKHAEESHKKDCCEDHTDNHSDCAGNGCGTSCHHSSQPFGVHQIAKNSDDIFHFEDKNSYPIYQQPHYSSGVYSIWQPPKIG